MQKSFVRKSLVKKSFGPRKLGIVVMTALLSTPVVAQGLSGDIKRGVDTGDRAFDRLNAGLPELHAATISVGGQDLPRTL